MAKRKEFLLLLSRLPKVTKLPYEPLLDALAARGHDVTIVSPVPAKKVTKNLREIFTIDMEETLHAAAMPNVYEAKASGRKVSPMELLEKFSVYCDESLILPQLKGLQKEKFDLVILPLLLNECGMVYGSTFNATTILISPMGIPPAIASFYGNPSPPSFVPNYFTGYTQHMTFRERLVNLITETLLRLTFKYYSMPRINERVRDKLKNSNLPGVFEIIQSSSLMLVNSHFTVAAPLPFLPDIIEVGGMHCRPAQPLPNELETFVTGHPNGFILFSLGSALKGSSMPEWKRLQILNAFARLNLNVLWKWETEKMDDLPENVKLSKWLPQQDVLGHANIRAFVTHGGLGSTTEAVYHGVPIVGIPMFADQKFNMETARRKGYAITLDFMEFTEETLYEAINQILNEPKYKETVKSISALFQDQPQSPLERAIYWTEYAIRHKGAPQLRSAARDLNFFQYYSLDVIGALLAFLLLAFWVLMVLVKFIVRIISRRIFTSVSVKNKKHN